LNEIDQLEQELIALRQRFAQSAAVLEELYQIKGKFDNLSDSYQTLQSAIDQAKAFLEASSTASSIEPRFAQVEAQMNTRYEQIQAQLTNLRFDFEATTRQLREDAERSPQKTSQGNLGDIPSLGNVEDENRIKWMESSLQHLNTSVYSDRAALQKLDRRVNTLKRTIDIVAVAGAASVIFLGLLMVIFRQ
jgi:DNA repair exonuclease SbcCD ATPase subunit